jgi:SAM-dependent methyltransferase
VLDVGCGMGHLAGEIARRHPEIEVQGIELAADQLARGSRDLPNLHLRQGDAQQLPYESSRFDVVYCRFLLEHVPSPLKVLSEMHRVLRSGGSIFVQENNILVDVFDPDCPSFDAIWRKFAALQTRLGGDALIGRKLFGLLKRTGFRDIRLSIAPDVHWSGSPGFRAWVENLMANVSGAADKLCGHGLATREEIDAGLDDLRRLLERTDATALFYWNRAAATK